MTARSHFVNQQWIDDGTTEFSSVDPTNQQIIWQGKFASYDLIDYCISAARSAFNSWSQRSFEYRFEAISRFISIIQQSQTDLAKAISMDTGKPLWEAKTEVAGMISKLTVTKQAYIERCRNYSSEINQVNIKLQHKPHGVLVVFGPFNFPGHIPNGHIIPALLAGNAVILKPSEQVPYFSGKMLQCWEQANLPNGVINMLQGDADVSKYLVDHKQIDGILFTGSSRVGQIINQTIIQHPQRIIALELGGNNPLVFSDCKDITTAAYNTIQSAYITSGQRCTCARRLIVVSNNNGKQFVDKLVSMIRKIVIGSYQQNPEPFMGPVISEQAATNIYQEYKELCNLSGKALVEMQYDESRPSFITPGLIDCSEIEHYDNEIFGPLLQLYWADDLEHAIYLANDTKYGLSAGILCDNQAHYTTFYQNTRAGIINWNRPITGASSNLPFGGVGLSGNHRPSAYYAADYCAYPVASMEQAVPQIPDSLTPGISIEDY